MLSSLPANRWAKGSVVCKILGVNVKIILYPFRKIYFTLIELVVTMAVFLVLVGIILNFYNTAFNATSSSAGNSMMFENARIAMDLITRDIQCIYYKKGAIPFWHWAPVNPASPPATWKRYRNELLAFVSATDVPPNDECISNLCEIKYQLYYSTNKTDENNGWLRRSVTGDKTRDGENKKWNFYYNFKVGYTTNSDAPVSSFTANSNSSENYQKVIPYVTDLSFTCYKKDGTVIAPDNTTGNDAEVLTEFPYSVHFSLSILDKNSWGKWLSLFPDGSYPGNEPASAKTFRDKHERTFTKTIFIGDHGQYD